MNWSWAVHYGMMNSLIQRLGSFVVSTTVIQVYMNQTVAESHSYVIILPSRVRHSSCSEIVVAALHHLVWKWLRCQPRLLDGVERRVVSKTSQRHPRWKGRTPPRQQVARSTERLEGKSHHQDKRPKILIGIPKRSPLLCMTECASRPSPQRFSCYRLASWNVFLTLSRYRVPSRRLSPLLSYYHRIANIHFFSCCNGIEWKQPSKTNLYDAVGISLLRSGWQTASYGTSDAAIELLVDLVDLAVPWVTGFEFLAIPRTSNSGSKPPYCFLSGSESRASNSRLFPELQTQAWSLQLPVSSNRLGVFWIIQIRPPPSFGRTHRLGCFGFPRHNAVTRISPRNSIRLSRG